MRHNIPNKPIHQQEIHQQAAASASLSGRDFGLHQRSAAAPSHQETMSFWPCCCQIAPHRRSAKEPAHHSLVRSSGSGSLAPSHLHTSEQAGVEEYPTIGQHHPTTWTESRPDSWAPPVRVREGTRVRGGHLPCFWRTMTLSSTLLHLPTKAPVGPGEWHQGTTRHPRSASKPDTCPNATWSPMRSGVDSLHLEALHKKRPLCCTLDP